ncbi:hypothetical protein [Thiobaca trueperi]|uniref:Uncharacterized protein n=1 Tax=Thiobaca trueperi TaxID=127458 RepID=A0A4R3MYJ6_9GAMM|nr:hypothetical protein [Thiobaca trueperi]TCT21464.1 hypothetical protein EDC35_104322 [Thiobaca trueperi]
MNVEQHVLLIIQSAIPMFILPTSMIFVNRLLIQHLDNRGMYSVPPFSWLPILAGLILCAAALDAMEVTSWLNPEGIWLSDYWSLRLDELYDIWLNPFDILFALIAGLIQLRLDMLDDSWRPWVFQALFWIALAVALLAWRSWQAMRGVLLFCWATLTTMVVGYMAVIILAWIMYWLNFWLLFVIFIFLYLYDQDGDLPQRSPL